MWGGAFKSKIAAATASPSTPLLLTHWTMHFRLLPSPMSLALCLLLDLQPRGRA